MARMTPAVRFMLVLLSSGHNGGEHPGCRAVGSRRLGEADVCFVRLATFEAGVAQPVGSTGRGPGRVRALGEYRESRARKGRRKMISPPTLATWQDVTGMP